MSHLRRTFPLLAALCLLNAAAPDAAAAKKKAEEAGETAAESPPEEKKEEEKKKAKKPGDKPFAEVIEGFEVLEGLFTFYRDEKQGKTFLEIRPEQLGKTYLCSITRQAGDGYFFDSGAMLSELPFVFERVGKKIHFSHRNVLFRADADTAIHRAIGSGLSDSLLGAADVASAPHPDRGSVLVDPAGFFVWDVAAVGYIFQEFLKEYPYAFDKEHSHFGAIRSFPENSEIDVVLRFQTAKPKIVPTLPDPRSFRHVYRYSLSSLPATGFEPRLADDRIGHFVTMHQDYSTQLTDTPYVRYVNRFHLEKAEPKFELSRPRQPIVFWLENTIPVEHRDAVREGVLLWNSAFERIGFKDAIVVRQMPDDADWDPADVRYNTVRWIVQPGGGYAVGPSRTDPFSGQIYDADIRVSADMLRFTYKEFVELADPVSWTGRPSARGDAIAARLGISSPARGLCDHQSGAARRAAFGWSLASARAAAGGAGGVDLEEYLHQFLVDIMAHEVGHTLGLRHNFKASTIRAVEELHAAGVAHTGSVMDYNPPNIAPPGEKQGPYYQTTLGPYDYWAIEYAYTPIDGGAESEAAMLERIASRVADPLLQYGTDEDAWFGPRGMDPTATRWDLGSDSVDFYRGRAALARELWSVLEERFEKPGERYQRLRQVFHQGLDEYVLGVLNVTKWIGGIYHRRDHVGDPGGRLPFEPVPAVRQRQALEFLSGEVFAPDAFEVPPSLLDKLASERFWDFTFSIFEEPRSDYPIHDVIRSIQSLPLDHLFDPLLMSRMLDVELRGGDALTLAEVFSSVREAIWAEVAAARDVGSVRRGLQRLHLDKLVALVVAPAPGVPEDARALARADLKALAAAIPGALGSTDLDDYTRAHLDETLATAGAALEAGIERRLAAP